jgi:Uma2 family endonuclease
MAVARKKIYTPEQYLQMEERSELRHEFVNGEIYDMAGTTARHNRTRKFQIYRKPPSLQEYVMVEQNHVSVECFRRIESGLWVFEGYETTKDTLRLKSVDMGIPLAAIYENVEIK